MERRNQYIAIGIIAIIAIAAGVGGAVYFMQAPEAKEDTIIFGTGAGPHYIDPLDVWDSASFNVLDQCGEALLGYDLTDPLLPMIPVLATAKGTWSGPNYTIELKTGITFHDGTPFNADAVKFTYDRLNYFCNATGQATDDDLAYVTELYLWPNGTFILNHTEVIDATHVKFCLNYYYAVWEPLMTFGACYIISPTAHSGTARFGANDFVIGTGPFVCESYTAGDEFVFSRNEDYWRGPSKIKTVVFSIIEDPNARNTALLTGDINFLDDPLPELINLFEQTSGITMLTAAKGAVRASQIQYVGFNTQVLNKTWREALSYAIDYDYIIDEIMLGTAVRLKSNIPVGIQYANETLDIATFNITRARMVLQTMGFGAGWNATYDPAAPSANPNNINWTSAAFKSRPGMIWNYSYNADNLVRAQIGLMLQDDLNLIGVNLFLIGLSWASFIRTTYGIPPYSKDDLCLWFLGWIPDYNDPSNFCNPLFTVTSLADDTQTDDAYLTSMMALGLVTAGTARKAVYDEIQRYVVEDLRPYGFAYSGYNIDAYASGLKGHPNNAMNRIYFYPCSFS